MVGGYQIDNYEVEIYEKFKIFGITLTLRIDGGITSVMEDNGFFLMLEVIYLDAQGDAWMWWPAQPS